MPNLDPGRDGIVAAIRDAGVEAIEHLPRPRFVRLLAGARAIVGNSSAGLIEAAVLRVPCVNIGERQGGRQRPGHVIDCPHGERPIREAIERALKLHRPRLRHPYGRGDTGRQIARRLADMDLRSVPLHKQNTV
jgi:UDP-N-acetylglucosamine 2-epimerase